jgi:hypothetical protein
MRLIVNASTSIRSRFGKDVAKSVSPLLRCGRIAASGSKVCVSQRVNADAKTEIAKAVVKSQSQVGAVRAMRSNSAVFRRARNNALSHELPTPVDDPMTLAKRDTAQQ